MTDSISIHYVGDDDEILHQIVFQLKQQLAVEVEPVTEITSLFSMLSDSKFNTDLIIIDIEKLFRLRGTDAFGLIDTLSTIINCTVFREDIGKPIHRSTKIVAAVSLNSEPKLIKEIVGTKISGFYPRGLEFSIEDKKTAITKILSTSFYIPPQIKELISSPKRKPFEPTEIILTPRQEQVAALIQDRGASNKVIAKMLNITESTVKLHVTQIFKKYGVRNRTQLAVFQKTNQ